MTAVTALFMIPTALVFPALLRKANTPPSSMTLARRRRVQRQIVHTRHTPKRGGRSTQQGKRRSHEKAEQAEECETVTLPGDDVYSGSLTLSIMLGS